MTTTATKKAKKAKKPDRVMADWTAIEAQTLQSGHSSLLAIQAQVVELDGILARAVASGRLDGARAGAVAAHAEHAFGGLASILRTLRIVLGPAPGMAPQSEATEEK